MSLDAAAQAGDISSVRHPESVAWPARVRRGLLGTDCHRVTIHIDNLLPRPGISFLSTKPSNGGATLDLQRAGGTETILLVEDDTAVRAVTRRALSRFGYTVLTAEGGQEAIRIAREHPEKIKLLLTDIMMPGMNGVEVAARVGEIRPGIRVFYMSGYADQDLVRQGLLTPGTRFLQKPFTPQELADRVRDILDR